VNVEASLITAKITPPTLPRGALVRASLLSEAQLAEVRLVLLQAPAGYGKSTSMVCQMTDLLRHGRYVAWMTLDGDETPDSLARGLAAAIAGSVLIPEAEGGPATAPATGTMASLLHLLHGLPAPLTLFLDELDAPADAAVLGELDRLIERMPIRHTVFAATRTRPALRLARLRVRGEVVDVGMERLAFTPHEIGSYLRNSGIDSFDDTQLASVHELTEGWPVAVQMAAHVFALSGKAGGLPDRLTLPDAGLSDYLAEEILANQPPELREFLLHSCVLRNLNPELCDRLTGRTDSRVMLERLVRDNLFVVELGTSGWVRYHRIFKDFLFHQLRVSAGGAMQVHRRAAIALAEMSIYREALENAVAADDPVFLIDFIALHGRAAIQRGVAAAIAAWARRQPLAALAAHPEALVVTAWAHLLVRDLERSKAEISLLHELARRDALGPPARTGLAMLEVTLAMILAEFDRGLALSVRHLGRLR